MAKRSPGLTELIVLISLLYLTTILTAAAQLPVITARPRILLDANIKASLLVKKNAADADWKAMLADAKKYLSGIVIPWNVVTASDPQYYATNNIFFSYSGSGWQDAAMALGMAHQLTKTNNPGANPTAYSNKLMELADVIIKAYADYPPNASGGPNIFQFNSSYATRHVGKTMGVIYDWCYDELGATRKAAMLHVMKDWFTYMSAAPYRVNQLQADPTGNYYVGHLICAAYMGYAIGADDPLSKKMIDFARERAIGTPGSLNKNTTTSGETAYNYFTQSVKGGLPSGASKSYLGPKTYLSAPQKDGIPNQGWAYGGATTQFLVDYILTVKTATGEDMLQTDASLKQFFTKTSEALVHAFTPNHFQLDNSNDNGSFVGSVADYALPLRLTALLEGTPEGANINYFYKNLLKPVNLISKNKGYPALNWEKFYFNKTRPSAVIDYKPYYPATPVNLYTSVPANSGMHKFYMRKDWSATSTWASVIMGIGAYDQHNHNHAGHFKIIRGDNHDGDDHLLIGTNEVAASGGNGIDGSTTYSYTSNNSNTLFIDDFNDYDPPYPDHAHTVGGQTTFGYDAPTHEEQNDNFSYFRADLTPAYLISYYNPDTTKRTVRYYYRSFLYLRNPDIFVVYDKFLIKNSTNPAGQYKKHLRWHFLQQPVVNGNNITAIQDNSRLFIHTVIPGSAKIAAVNENSNPDNTFGSSYNYAFNTNTWRTEVSMANDPLKQDIITVLQPGAKATAVEMVTSAIQTNQNNMEGSIIHANGKDELVLFNNNISKYPVRISSCSYAFTGPAATEHILIGMYANQKYSVKYNGNTITITRDNSGAMMSSPSGVLMFKAPVPISNDANLAKLIISSGALNPVFASTTITYTAQVANNVSNITVTPTKAQASATIKVNGVTVADGTASAAIPLAVGKNIVKTVVMAMDGTTTKTYTLTIIRAAPDFTPLSAIKLTPIAALVKTTGPANNNYTTSVAAGTASVTVTLIPKDNADVIRVNGSIVAGGTPSAPVILSSGPTIINVMVTEPGEMTAISYAITVFRNGSSNAAIAFKITPATTLITGTGSANYNYTGTVDASTSSVTVTPTAQYAGTTAIINGVAVPNGTPSGKIMLSVGQTVINITTTAEDGVTHKTYAITLIRPPVAGINKSFATATVIPAGVNAVEIKVHAALSPNGDGIDDRLQIDGLDAYPDNRLIIMRKTGAIVYEAKNYDNVATYFDGYDRNAKLIAAGTYLYILEYRSGNKTERKTGYVVVKF